MPRITAEQFNQRSADCMPGHMVAHLGESTQVWDAVVKHRETGKTLALFRCTQMVLYPK